MRNKYIQLLYRWGSFFHLRFFGCEASEASEASKASVASEPVKPVKTGFPEKSVKPANTEAICQTTCRDKNQFCFHSTCSASIGLTDGYKTKGLVQDAADAEERAEKAESLADAAQERMSLKEG